MIRIYFELETHELNRILAKNGIPRNRVSKNDSEFKLILYTYYSQICTDATEMLKKTLLGNSWENK